MTIKAEILVVLAGSKEPLTAPQILELCESAGEIGQVAPALSALKGDGLVDHAGKTAQEGGYPLMLWKLTAPGHDVVKGIEAKESAAPAPRAKAKKAKPRAAPPRKVKRGKKPAKRKAAKRIDPPAPAIAPTVEPRPRWAVTSDGSLVLVGTQTEIPKPAVRALIDFMRWLDELLVLEDD